MAWGREDEEIRTALSACPSLFSPENIPIATVEEKIPV